MSDMVKKAYEISIWDDVITYHGYIKTEVLNEEVYENLVGNGLYYFDSTTWTYTAAISGNYNSEIDYCMIGTGDSVDMEAGNIKNVIYSYYGEKKIAIIGSDTMTSPTRAVNGKLVRNINGTSTLTFDMYHNYEDENGDIVENPFVKLMVNERKVKVNYDGNWFDFIIKNIDESSDSNVFSYECTDLAQNELSKNGFNIELNVELENNQGTINELADSILEDSDWKRDGDSVINQTITEVLYRLTLAEGVSITAYYDTRSYVQTTDASMDSKKTYYYLSSNNVYSKFEGTSFEAGTTYYEYVTDTELITIDGQKPIYVYYTPMINKETGYFQFIYTDNGDGFGTPDLKEDLVTVDCNNETTYDCYIENISFNDDVPSFCNTEYGVSSYSGDRLVRKQLSGYDANFDKYVTYYTDAEGEKTYWCYTDTEYLDPEVIQNFVVNGGKDFTTNEGWTAIQGDGNSCVVELAYYPQAAYLNSKSYLKVQFADYIYSVTTDTEPQDDVTYYTYFTTEKKFKELTERKFSSEGTYYVRSKVKSEDPDDPSYSPDYGSIMNSGIKSNYAKIDHFAKDDKYVLRLDYRTLQGTTMKLDDSSAFRVIVAPYTVSGEGKYVYDSSNIYMDFKSDSFTQTADYDIAYPSTVAEINGKVGYNSFSYKSYETPAKAREMLGDIYIYTYDEDEETYYWSLFEKDTWEEDQKYSSAYDGYYTKEYTPFSYKKYKTPDDARNALGKIYIFRGGAYQIYEETTKGEWNEGYTYATVSYEKAKTFDSTETYYKKSLYLESIVKCSTDMAYSDMIKKQIGLFIIPSTNFSVGIDYYFSSIQFYKYLLDGNDERVDPGDAPESRVITHYYLYDPTEAANFDLDTYTGYVVNGAEEIPDDYYPMYGSGTDEFEKTRSITASESNRFNLIQDLCETFECWVRFIVQHDPDTGEILTEQASYTDENGNIRYMTRQKKYVIFYEGEYNDNYAGFKYGVNLQAIKRTLDSASIVTEIIVKPNSNEYATDGACSIQRAKDNPTKEDFALDFDYYTQQGLISQNILYNDLYVEGINGSIGLYPRLKALNSQNEERINNESILETSIMNLTASYQAYNTLATESADTLAENIADLKNYAGADYTVYNTYRVAVDSDFTVNTEAETYVYSFAPGGVYYEKREFDSQIYYITTEDDKLDDTKRTKGEYYVIADDDAKTRYETDQKVRDFMDVINTYQKRVTDSNSKALALANSEFDTEEGGFLEGTTYYEQSVSESGEYVYTKTEDEIPQSGKSYWVQKLDDDGNSYYAATGVIGKLQEEELSLKAMEDEDEDIQEKSEAVKKEFYHKYSRFVQEGSWNSDDYLDDDLYYLDALNVLYTSAFPAVKYTISVIDVSPLEDYENYIFDIGDKTYIEDTEFFGWVAGSNPLTPAKEEVIISEISISLDEPADNEITVQNYKTQFEDLFQRITATTQSLEYHSGEYAKAASAVTSTGEIDSSVMQSSLNNASYVISNSKDQSVVWDEAGISITSLTDASQVIRLTSGGIAISNDGGQNWTSAITGSGINANMITTGRLNTSEIYIYNGDFPSFRWDANGINAYSFNSNGYNFSKFVRFDQYGLYGISNASSSFNPQDVEDVIDAAEFSLTWQGFQLKSSHPGLDGWISITPSDDLVIWQNVTDKDTGLVTKTQRGKFGLIDDKNIVYGLVLNDQKGNATLQSLSDGSLWLKSKMTIGGDNSNESVVFFGQGDEDINGVFEVLTISPEKGEAPTLQILSDGSLIASQATLNGNINADTGNIGELLIENGGLSANGETISATPTGIKISSTNEGATFQLTDYKDNDVLTVSSDGLYINGTGTFNGTISATDGKIGGFVIEDDNIHATDESLYLYNNGTYEQYYLTDDTEIDNTKTYYMYNSDTQEYDKVVIGDDTSSNEAEDTPSLTSELDDTSSLTDESEEDKIIYIDEDTNPKEAKLFELKTIDGSFIKVSNIDIGDEAFLSGTLQIGKLKLINPMSHSSAVLSLSDSYSNTSANTYFELTDDGNITGLNWSIDNTGYAKFSNVDISGTINAATVDTMVFRANQVQTLGGKFIYRPGEELSNLVYNETEKTITFTISSDMSELCGFTFNTTTIVVDSNNSKYGLISTNTTQYQVKIIKATKLNDDYVQLVTSINVNFSATASHYTFVYLGNATNAIVTINSDGIANSIFSSYGIQISTIVEQTNATNKYFSTQTNLLLGLLNIPEVSSNYTNFNYASYDTPADARKALGTKTLYIYKDDIYQFFTKDTWESGYQYAVNLDSAYGLYCDNVYIKGKLVAEGTSVGAGMDTTLTKDFNSALVGENTSLLSGSDKIIFYAGAEYNNSSGSYKYDVQGAKFQVTDTGIMYAQSAVLSNSVIANTSIRTSKIYGTGSEVPLKIYYTNDFDSSNSRTSAYSVEGIQFINASGYFTTPEKEITEEVSLGITYKGLYTEDLATSKDSAGNVAKQYFISISEIINTTTQKTEKEIDFIGDSISLGGSILNEDGLSFSKQATISTSTGSLTIKSINSSLLLNASGVTISGGVNVENNLSIDSMTYQAIDNDTYALYVE